MRLVLVTWLAVFLTACQTTPKTFVPQLANAHSYKLSRLELTFSDEALNWKSYSRGIAASSDRAAYQQENLLAPIEARIRHNVGELLIGDTPLDLKVHVTLFRITAGNTLAVAKLGSRMVADLIFTDPATGTVLAKKENLSISQRFSRGLFTKQIGAKNQKHTPATIEQLRFDSLVDNHTRLMRDWLLTSKDITS